MSANPAPETHFDGKSISTPKSDFGSTEATENIVLFPQNTETRKDNLEEEIEEISDAIAFHSRNLAKLLEGNSSFVDMGDGFYIIDAKKELEIRRSTRSLLILLNQSEEMKKEYDALQKNIVTL